MVEEFLYFLAAGEAGCGAVRRNSDSNNKNHKIVLNQKCLPALELKNPSLYGEKLASWNFVARMIAISGIFTLVLLVVV